VAGAVELTCKFGVPVLVHPPRAWSGETIVKESHTIARSESLASKGPECARQIELQLLLEECLIDGIDEIDCAFMAASQPDSRRLVEFEYSLCGLAQRRSCSRLIGGGTDGALQHGRGWRGAKQGGAHSRRVGIDHCSSVAANVSAENMRKLVSHEVCVSCSVVQGDKACSLGVVSLDVSTLLTRAQTDMEGEVQWIGGTYHLVQEDSSRLLARLRLKVALRFRETTMTVLPAAAHRQHALAPAQQHRDDDAAPQLAEGDTYSDAGADASLARAAGEGGIPCTIVIQRACDLALDEHGCEPCAFVTCNVDGSTGTIQTARMERSCNPRWQHAQEARLQLAAGDAESRVLVFEVWRTSRAQSRQDDVTMNDDIGADPLEDAAIPPAPEDDMGFDREHSTELVGRAHVDLFQIQRGGAPIDGWYHVLDNWCVERPHHTTFMQRKSARACKLTHLFSLAGPPSLPPSPPIPPSIPHPSSPRERVPPSKGWPNNVLR
jgi:hypothetical protein